LEKNLFSPRGHINRSSDLYKDRKRKAEYEFSSKRGSDQVSSSQDSLNSSQEYIFNQNLSQ
jgi:hypothetical protein